MSDGGSWKLVPARLVIVNDVVFVPTGVPDGYVIPGHIGRVLAVHQDLAEAPDSLMFLTVRCQEASDDATVFQAARNGDLWRWTA